MPILYHLLYIGVKWRAGGSWALRFAQEGCLKRKDLERMKKMDKRIMMLVAGLAWAGAALAATHEGVQLWENGPLWAKTNVGANSPTETGYYFWWGDTLGYKWQNEQWVASDGSVSGFSFSNENVPTYGKTLTQLQSMGAVGADGNLLPAYDAAAQQWGDDWRVPKSSEIKNLMELCTWSWTTNSGVAGYTVTGKGLYSGNSVFLPVAGYGTNATTNNLATLICQWSSTVDETSSFRSYFSVGTKECRALTVRSLGISIRPVKSISVAKTSSAAALDTRTGERVVDATESIAYDAAWGDASSGTLKVNGTAVSGLSSKGIYSWTPNTSQANYWTLTYTAGTVNYSATFMSNANIVMCNANGGAIGGESVVSFQVEGGKTTNQDGANLTAERTGYSLLGWYDTSEPSGGNMVFDARGYAVNGTYWNGAYAPGVSAATWKYAGNVTVYARWVKSPSYQVVTFDANGGVIGNAAYAAVAVESGKYTMQAGASGTGVARTGYTLRGWYDAKIGGNMVFDARGYAVNGVYWNGAYSQGASAATWKHAGNVVAYAQWVATPPYRIVTFDANGGMIGNQSCNCVVEQGKYTSQAGASVMNATRTGYTLEGWYDAKTGGNMVFDAHGYAVNGKYWNGSYEPKVSAATWKFDGNVVAYARWAPAKYTATLIANGGSVSGQPYVSAQTEYGKYTNQAAANRTVVREGYSLVGWFDVSGDMVFDARGYAVNGKYWNGAYSPKVSAATWKYAGNVTAYARWVKSPPYWVVTFDANGGKIGNATYAAEVVESGKYTMQAGASGTAAVRAGYVLVGWYDTTNSVGGNMVFDARGYAVNGKYWNGAYSPKVSAATWKYDGNVTAYARWVKSPPYRVVTLDANGGAEAYAAVVVENGKYTSQAGASGTEAARAGYTLVGWFDTTNAVGGNMVFDARGYAVNGTYWNGAYSPGVSSATWKYAGNVTAYARWVASPQYQVVTFDANGGTIGNATYAAVAVESGKYTMQAGASGTKVARAGYVLIGWFDTNAASGGNMVFDERGYAVAGKYWNGSYEPKVSAATWKFAGNVVAYARWVRATYTVTLNANGGSLGGQPSVAVQVEYGKSTNQAVANQPVSYPGNYKLVGWYDTSAESGGNMVFDERGYAVSGRYWNGSYDPSGASAVWKYAGNVTVYARWARATYTVTLIANGGTVDGQSAISFQVEVGESTNQAAANRETKRDNYALIGWYDMDGNMVFDAMGYAIDGKYWDGDYWPNSSSATWKYVGSVTAYARWVPIASNIRMAASGNVEDGFGLGGFVGDALRFFQGEFVGVFSDGGGRFMLTLDEGLETAYFVTWTEDGGVACECEAAVAGDVLILTAETGAVYHLVWDEDGLVATHVE